MLTMTMTTRTARYFPMMAVLFLALLVGGSSSSSNNIRMLQTEDEAEDAAGETVLENYARAAHIFDEYVHSGESASDADSSRTRKGDAIMLTIQEEEPESHNLHSDSIEKERNRERKREGTAKYRKNKKGGGTSKGTKGNKKGSAGKNSFEYGASTTSPPKKIKGEKSKYAEADDDDHSKDDKYAKEDKYGKGGVVGGDDDDGNDDGDGHGSKFGDDDDDGDDNNGGKYGVGDGGVHGDDDGDDDGNNGVGHGDGDDDDDGDYGVGDGDDDGDDDGNNGGGHGADDGDDDDDDDSSVDYRDANATTLAPVFTPILTPPTLTIPPSTAPPIAIPVIIPVTATPIDATLGTTVPGTPPPDPVTVPHVSRLIPSFRVMYTITGTPESSDYAEVTAVTRNFIHDTLVTYMGGVNNVMYLDTKLEFYFIRGVFLLEYQFKTQWGAGGNQVPSIQELSLVVRSFFEINLPAYLASLTTELRPENAFSTTTAVAVGTQGTNVAEDGTESGIAEPPERNVETSSKVSTKIIIPVSIIAGVAIVLVLVAYFRRRKVGPAGSVASDDEEISLKPDEDMTLNTAPMASISASISPRRSSEIRHRSAYMEPTPVSSQRMINQLEDGFEDISIDPLAEV